MSGDVPDYLAQAIRKNQPAIDLMAPLPATPERLKAEHDRKAEEEHSAAATATAARLSQEAFADDPEKIRKIFPKLLDDYGFFGSKSLDLRQINEGIKSGLGSEEERNALQVLKAGYKEFSPDIRMAASMHGAIGPDAFGVSGTSLSALDKAINRNIKENPYRSFELSCIVPGGLLIGAEAVGLEMGLYKAPWQEALTSGAVVAVGTMVWLGYRTYRDSHNGTEDKAYDQVKSNYQAFLKDFHQSKGPIQ